MVGIASLAPQQGQQAPGQAPMPGMGQPMPGMMPKPSAATPAAEVNQYAGMQLPQLIALFQQRPSGPLLGVITKQAEAMELQKAQANQAAMAQAQQQQGTVKDMAIGKAVQAMRPTQMAAHGGIMRGYAGGGAVAFQSAGAVPPGLLNPDVDEEGLPRGKDEREQIIDYNNKVRAAYERQMKAKAATGSRTAAPSMQDIAGVMAGRRQLEQFYKPRESEAYTPERVGFRVGEGAPLPAATSVPMRMQDTRGGTPEMAALAQLLGSGAAPAPSPAPADPRRQPGAAPAASADTGLPVDTPIDMAAYRQRLENLASEMRTGSGPSEAVLSGRQGLAALAAQNIAEQRKEAKAAEAAAKAELERRLQYTRSSPFSDAQSLFRIAAAIDPRRGKGMGSLSGAISGEMEKRTAAGEEAQKAFATSQEAARQRNALIRQAQFLEATRAHAEAVGDDATERQARQQLATLYTELEKFNVDVQQKSKDQALARYNAQSQRLGAEASRAQAAKPTDAQSRIALYRSDPKAYEAMYGSKESASVANLVRAVNSDPRLKKLAESILPDAEAQYNARYKELVATYAPELLLGAGGGGGASGGARAAADKILSGG